MEKIKNSNYDFFFLSLARPSFTMTDAMINNTFGSQLPLKMRGFLERQID